MSKASRFAPKLTEIFEAVEPQFRADEIARYIRYADRTDAEWRKLLEGPEPEHRYGARLGELPTYTFYKKDAPVRKGAYSRGEWWAEMQAGIAAGYYEIDHARAEADARNAIATAKHNFVAKISKKLDNATFLVRGKVEATGLLSYNGGTITGHLTIKAKPGKFTLRMNIIVNHRYQYGTSFYQFPARFADVILHGVPVLKPSESWMKANFG